MATNISDAALFTEVVRELRSRTSSGDRRKSERHTYPTVRLAIPDDDDEPFVTPEMFTNVACHDISTNGISIVLPCPPGFRRAVVVLGEPPHVIHMIVEVLRCERHLVSPNQFLVGCQFVHRLPGDNLGWKAAED